MSIRPPIFLFAAALAAGAGCRDYADDRGRELGAVHVLAGRAADDGGPRIVDDDLIAGFFVSDDAALIPLRDHLRTLPFDIRGDILGSFTVSLPTGLVTTRVTGGEADARRGAAAFSMPVQGVLDECAAATGTITDLMTACPTFSLGSARDFLDHLTFDLRRETIDVRWADATPTIELHLVFDADPDPKDWVPIDPPSGTVELIVTATVGTRATSVDPSYVAFYGPGADLVTPFADVSLSARLGDVTGFGDFRGALLPTVTRVVNDLGAFLGSLRARPLGGGEASTAMWSAWCTARPGGCPFSSAALARFADGSSFQFRTSRWRLGDGRTVDLRSPAVSSFAFTDALTDLLALGGDLTEADVRPAASTSDFFACARCGDAEEQPGDCSICSACMGATDPAVLAVCDGAAVRMSVPGAVTAVPPTPLLASLEQAVFGLAGQLREVATAPLEAYNRGHVDDLRYTRIVRCPAAGALCPGGVDGVAFFLPVDDDEDGVSFVIDNCPLVANPDQADADADGRGDDCDPCPTVVGWAGGDLDRDGTPDLCDCDADDDGCTNSVVDLDGERCELAGEIYDERRTHANPVDTGDHDLDGDRDERLDFDGDGVMDDCDADDDGDDVADVEDNCRWIANADQTDSNGDGRGDVCDSLCPYPGAPRCDDLLDLGSVELLEMSELLGRLPPWPVEPWCIVDGPGCWLLVGIDPFEGIDRLTLAAGVDGHVVTRTAKELELEALGAVAAVRDLDGDGRGDLAIGVPATHQVIALSSVTLERLWTWTSPFEGEAGAALLGAGDALWVGAPGAVPAKAPTGAVVRLDLAAGAAPAIGTIVWGDAEGERFGEVLAGGVVGGDARVLVGAPEASTGDAKRAGRFTLLDGSGDPLGVYDGQVDDAGPGATAALVVDGADVKAVVVAAPAALDGAGLVTVHDPAGEPRWKAKGEDGAALGASLAILSSPKGPAIAAGAPHAGKAGRVDVWTVDGDELAVVKGYDGAELGRTLATLPDLDADGAPELALGTLDGTYVLSTGEAKK